MNKLFHSLRRATIALLSAVLIPCLTSCELVELDFDTETQQIVSMDFIYDTVYVMPGDTFFLAPYFYPDTLVMKNIYLHSEYDSIVSVQGDTILAAGVGSTQLYAESAVNGLKDTCTVMVIDPWVVNPNDYYQDQLLYLDVDFGENQHFDPSSMMLGAFLFDDTCVGVGQMIEGKNGQQRLVMRCWNDYLDPDLDIHFRLYYRRTLQLGDIVETVPFDGQTRGTPSAPLILTPVKKEEPETKTNKAISINRTQRRRGAKII